MTELINSTAAAALLADRMGAMDVGGTNTVPPTVASDVTTDMPDPRYYRPLVEAADDFAREARTLKTGQRFYTGIPSFDDAMRGLSPKQLMLVQGYAHSGKTVFVTEAICHNHLEPMVLFTPDEDRVLILTKLVSRVEGVSAEELERRIADGDEQTEKMIRGIASDYFPNLAVFDDIADLRKMTAAVDECRQVWGRREAVTIFDYAQLLSYGDGSGDVVGKIDGLKGWGKSQDTPLIVMHQSSRTKGSDGGAVTIDSGTHGGEQQATFVIGVRRKKNFYTAQIADLEARKAVSTRDTSAIDLALETARYELSKHLDSITFNVVKNKRPPSRLVDDTDFHLDRDTGRITPYNRREAGRYRSDPARVYGVGAAAQTATQGALVPDETEATGYDRYDHGEDF